MTLAAMDGVQRGAVLSHRRRGKNQAADRAHYAKHQSLRVRRLYGPEAPRPQPAVASRSAAAAPAKSLTVTPPSECVE